MCACCRALGLIRDGVYGAAGEKRAGKAEGEEGGKAGGKKATRRCGGTLQ